MKFIGKVVSYLLLTVIGVLLAFTVFLFASNKLHPNEMPSAFGYKVMTVLSGSMRPEFDPGDMVIGKEVNTSTLKPKDIITFKRPDNKYVTHRIMDIKNSTSGAIYTTKGDANNSIDPETTQESQVVAKYLFHIPHLGMILQQLSGLYGFLVLVVLPIVLLFLLEYIDSAKRKKKREKRIPPTEI